MTGFKTLFIIIRRLQEKRLKQAKEVVLVQADDFFLVLPDKLIPETLMKDIISPN